MKTRGPLAKDGLVQSSRFGEPATLADTFASVSLRLTYLAAFRALGIMASYGTGFARAIEMDEQN